MSLAFIDRAPTPIEIQKLRLVLSTFQDGTGQLVGQTSPTLPGWRDFERSVALAFGGESQESKYIFDVLIPDPVAQDVYYGLSCKMRRTLDETIRLGRVTIELSNSAGVFWRELGKEKLNQKNYKLKPKIVGQILLTTVERWHRAASLERDRTINTAKSYYLSLSWNKKGWYQLHQFALQLPNHRDLHWDFPPRQVKGRSIKGRRLAGNDRDGKIFEWYGESGGQLKYYPPVSRALWSSEPFQLESLPNAGDQDYGILSKAAAYFPALWREIAEKAL